MPLPREKASHKVFQLFGSEARTRAAMSFIPDPETSKTTREIAETIGKPPTSMGDALIQLEQNGLLEQHNPDIGPISYSRIEHPVWAVYESAKAALTGMGIVIQSFVDRSE